MTDDIIKIMFAFMLTGGGLAFVIQRVFYNKDKKESEIKDQFYELKTDLKNEFANVIDRMESNQKESLKHREKLYDIYNSIKNDLMLLGAKFEEINAEFHATSEKIIFLEQKTLQANETIIRLQMQLDRLTD